MNAQLKCMSLVLASLGCLLAGCLAAGNRSEPSAKDMAAINRFNEQYLHAINAGDAAALSRLTDENHVMIAPNRPILEGKAANDAANSGAFARFKIAETWQPVETVVSGDLAYQRGSFTVTATPRDGGEQRYTHGNFLRIYRRQSDGTWQMTRDMFSSDHAAAP